MSTFNISFGVAAIVLVAHPALAAPNALSATAIEAAGFQAPPDKPASLADPHIVKASVLLARAHFSPGSIDGQDGDNFRHALLAFQTQSGLSASGKLDEASWTRLIADKAPIMTRYTVTAADARGPYTARIPADFKQQSRLKHMGFRNIREALAERFHMSPTLLVGLNPGRAFRAGETLDVVAPDGAPLSDKAASLVVDKTMHAVEALGPDGKLLAVFPASIGSEEKPAPSGRFEVTGAKPRAVRRERRGL